MAARKTVRIPDVDWKCPKCGAGYEYVDNRGNAQQGVVIEVDLDVDVNALEGPDPEDSSLFYADMPMVCYKCDWSGTTGAVARAAAKRQGLVKCSCCNGSGWVRVK